MQNDGTAPIQVVPDEILLKVLSLVYGKTLMCAVPQVCKKWREMCIKIKNVHLDFTFKWKKVPPEVLSGFRSNHGIGGCAAASTTREEWASGMCELFPRTTSITMVGRKHEVGVTHMMALSNKCRGLTHANFSYSGLADAEVIALVDKCHGLTHANFGACSKLTNTAVLALADKCPGLEHVVFCYCDNLTDAAVRALADKCRGLKHADFSHCYNLTDAAVVALADKCRGLKHTAFRTCRNLTNAAVIALADKCRGLVHVNFKDCWRLTRTALLAVIKGCVHLNYTEFPWGFHPDHVTDETVFAITYKRPGLEHADLSHCYNLTNAALLAYKQALVNARAT